jgi:hypothetical protein
MISLILIDEDDNVQMYTASEVSDMLDKPFSTLMAHCAECNKLVIKDFMYTTGLCDKCSRAVQIEADWTRIDTSHE